eukprot:NODE_6468_length_637_cov_55.276471_g6445_i0.p1 GENE.NODE_6468_length_637_cov_55.276471_g6445_i0~~NODE_6468_length_637_cov_55.276471_g6445_i0.p1  ORF type:complete len:164 (+),score=47.20 NODE_6468_length_637_cov_55.276471_g6445_i0:27-494(+)
MGGVAIDTQGRVLSANGDAVHGLFAAGEITGGIHGKNRLAGNALTEAVVFGMLVGQSVHVHADTGTPPVSPTAPTPTATTARVVNAEELARHNTASDCWLAVHGNVYDFTSFLEEHPAGPEAIAKLAGTDGTQAFAEVHTKVLLEDFEPLGAYSP